MSKEYTKAKLQDIVATQQDNLNVLRDLLKIMTHKNELLNTTNITLRNEIIEIKKQ